MATVSPQKPAPPLRSYTTVNIEYQNLIGRMINELKE
jgi:hypothetical protein